MVGESITDKVTYEQKYEIVLEFAVWISLKKIFQAEVTDSARKQAWHIQGTAKRHYG